MTSACAAMGMRKSRWTTPSAYFSGSRTHTRTSTLPAMRSAMARCEGSSESISGRSTSTVASPGAQLPSTRTRWSMASQSNSSVAPAAVSGTTAVGRVVVGRMRAVRVTSVPVRALVRLDLPDPVAPRRAATVVSGARRLRWEVCARTSRARTSSACMPSCSPRPTACSSPSRMAVRPGASAWSVVTESSSRRADGWGRPWRAGRSHPSGRSGAALATYPHWAPVPEGRL